MITAITCTGDRNVVFKFCEMWMSRQTKLPDQWIIVDDGKGPTEVVFNGCNVQYIRREPKMDDPPHTLGLNLCTALPHVKGDKVIFIEDDDYYKPQYIEKMDQWLDKSNICGQPNAIYYNLKYRWWQKHPNTKHASLCQTGIRRDLIRFLIPLCEDNLRYIDIDLWRIVQGRKYLDMGERLCVGLKGLPGRGGIGMGHDDHDTNDPDYSKFITFLGEDADVYLKLFNIVPKKIEYPEEVIKCRRNVNGQLILPKRNPRIEAILDDYGTRVEPLVWVLNATQKRIDVKDFRDMYKGKPAYIIGKGPSLDKLKAHHFLDTTAPVITINESIHKVEEFDIKNPIYAVQQDSNLQERCWSKRGTMMIPHITGAWYRKHPKVCIYSMVDLGGREDFHPQSIVAATRIARLMGCSRLIYLAFDSYINGDGHYANCIGYHPEGAMDRDRWAGQHRTFAPEVLGVNHEFRPV